MSSVAGTERIAPLEYQPYREMAAGGRRNRPSRRDRMRGLALVAADLAGVSAGLAVSGFARPSRGFDYGLALLPLLLVLLNKVLGLYDRDASVIDKSTLQELPRVVESLAIAAGLILLFGPVSGVSAQRHQALVFALVTGSLTIASRAVARHAVTTVFDPERAVIVGSGDVAEMLTDKLQANPRYGIHVVGYIDLPGSCSPAGGDGPPLLGDLGGFRDLCRCMRIERVIVAFATFDHENLLDAIRATNALGLKLSIVPRLFEVLGRSLLVDEVEGMSMLAAPGLIRSRSALAAKRAMDIVGSILLLTLTAPLLLVIAVMVKLTSPGPVLFSQVRVGRHHRPFKIYKFRTMVDDAEALKGSLAHLNEAPYPLFKIAEDPRLTRIGRVIRRTSLDELPQLWNVLRGEMSLVGPRPLVPDEDEKVIGWHRARLDIAPGLTGQWQVMGRSAVPLLEMVKLDYRYIMDWSLWNDIKLLVRTAPIVLLRRGL